jgi:hypothetical protein
VRRGHLHRLYHARALPGGSFHEEVRRRRTVPAPGTSCLRRGR